MQVPHSSVYLSFLAAINIAIAIAIATSSTQANQEICGTLGGIHATIMKLDTSDLQLTIICRERGLVQQVLINKLHENCCKV